MNQIFSNKSLKLLQADMSICMDDLNCKILSDSPEYIDFFKDLVEYMVDLYPLETQTNDIYSMINQEYLNNHLLSFVESYGITENDTKAYFIFDNLRHVFVGYRLYGLCQAYKNREAEDWYPKMIIRKILLSENDFDQINDELIIYRGMREDEYLRGLFGQSWTTNITIANKFAFQHYAGQPKYEGTVRVVVKTKIHKKNIYYYENHDENEVVIDEREISKNEVELIHRNVL